jgi:hypothetical protein
MERETALEQVDEVTVTASEKKQLDQYEPCEATASLTATVPDDMDAGELQEELAKEAQEAAKRDVLRRWESYLRQSDDE